MIRVLSITAYKADDSTKLGYEAFHFKTYETNQWLTAWRERLEREWEKECGFPVKIYVNRRTKPAKKLDMMSVLMNTAIVMGQDIDDVLSKTRKREVVEVRKITCMILFDSDYDPMEVERGLPFKNRTVYDYRVKMENRFMYEKGYEERYEAIKKQVSDITTGMGEEYKEDGSGKKKEENDKPGE